MFEISGRVGRPVGEAVSHAAPLEIGTEFVHLCERHGLAALIFEQLTVEQVHMPQVTRQAFEAATRRTLGQARKVQKLTGRVLDVLNAVNITPVALKGYGLAKRLYPNALVRVSSDVDVLVAAHEVEPALKAVESLGLTPQHRPAVGDEHHEIALEGPAGLVELHHELFRVFGRGAITAAEVLRRSSTSTLDGRPVKVLHPEDELLYLAVHAANHSFLRAAWLVDIMLAARHHGLRWAALFQEARSAHVLASFTTALLVCESALGPGALPPEALHTLKRADALTTLFSKERLGTARVAEHRVGAFVSRLLMNDTVTDAGLEVARGLRRALRQVRAAW